MAVKPEPYDYDDPVLLETTFYNDTNQLVNPSTVELHIYDPDGDDLGPFVTPAVLNPSTGKFTYLYTVADGWGVYRYWWKGRDLVTDQGTFRVRKPPGEEGPDAP